MITLVPYLVAVFAIASYALLGPIAKKVGVDLPPFSFIACSSLILGVCAGVIGYLFERDTVASAFHQIRWDWLLAFSLINLIGYVGYLWAIARMPVAQYDMFGILMPVIGGLFAMLLLKEPFHARYVVALAFMAVGLYIAIGPDLIKKG